MSAGGYDVPLDRSVERPKTRVADTHVFCLPFQVLRQDLADKI
jgi:hypothetical protein